MKMFYSCTATNLLRKRALVWYWNFLQVVAFTCRSDHSWQKHLPNISVKYAAFSTHHHHMHHGHQEEPPLLLCPPLRRCPRFGGINLGVPNLCYSKNHELHGLNRFPGAPTLSATSNPPPKTKNNSTRNTVVKSIHLEQLIQQIRKKLHAENIMMLYLG